MRLRILACFFILLFSSSIFAINESEIKAVTFAKGLNHPWGLDFLPDGRIFITERSGNLRVLSAKGLSKPITGIPRVVAKGQGGLLDVAIAPDFVKNKWVYFTYVTGNNGIGTELGRGKFVNNKIVSFEVLFRLLPKTHARVHFGSRIVFDNKGYVFVTLGDRGERYRAQNLNDHAGSVIRLKLDGSIPKNNPFVNKTSYKPEIYSYGHRNIQGSIWHPDYKQLWTHEHGPQGGDEINIIKKSKNYGWPKITYGKEYVTGFKIGEASSKKGYASPIHYWGTSIAPSGMAIYKGNKFKEWNNDLLIGSLKFQQLVRIKLQGTKVIKEQRLFTGKFGRIRTVKVDKKDGYIWLLTDSNNGKLIRLEPS